MYSDCKNDYERCQSEYEDYWLRKDPDSYLEQSELLLVTKSAVPSASEPLGDFPADCAQSQEHDQPSSPAS